MRCIILPVLAIWSVLLSWCADATLIATGSTDVTTYFVLRDSTTHAPKTDVTVTDLDLYYVEDGAAISAKADATALAAADSAHGDSQAFNVGQGVYRIDWPDAAFDGGAGRRVILIVVCSGVDTTYLEQELSPAVGTAAAVSGAVGSVTSGVTLAADAVDAAAVKADAVTELQSGLATAAAVADVPTVAEFEARTLVAASYFDPTTDPVTAGTVSDKTGYALADATSDAVIAGAVWEALTSGYGGVGTYGAAVEALESGSAPTAGEVADAVWDEALSGHSTAGTAGKGLADAASAAGLGAILHEYPITREDTGAPVPDVRVLVSSDEAGRNIVKGTYSNELGRADLHYDVAGTYFYWRYKAGWTFENPDEETVAAGK